MTPVLHCLHALPAHIAGFQSLITGIAPQQVTNHVVADGLLRAAGQVGGVTPEIRAQLRRYLAQLGAEPGDVVLCTCSTLGGAAEEEGAALGLRALRVDRPMAEAAMAAGPRCLVVACLESTVAPTLALLQSCANQAGVAFEPRLLIAPHLWHHYEAGRGVEFARAIADLVLAALAKSTSEAPVQAVVLAQASMAGASALCGAISIPVLSSPQLGVQRALAMVGQERHLAPDAARGV